MKFSATVTLQYDTPFSPYRAFEFKAALEWLRESGFDGAEICISDYRSCDVGKLKNMLDDYGLECSTISTGQAVGREAISLLQEGVALEKAQERLGQHIEAAAELGSKVTVGLLRGVGSRERCCENVRLLAERMAPLLDDAGRRGVQLLLEPINRYETFLLNQASETSAFIRKELGGLGRVGVLWDLFHANIEDPDFNTALDCIGDVLGHIHLADSNRWFPGYGHLNFEKLIGAIQETGFSGYYSFECLNLPSPEIVKTEAGNFIRNMRTQFPNVK